jgi:RNA polymerase sigma-70 factor (ECF subfamily)
MPLPTFSDLIATLKEGKPDSWTLVLGRLAPRLVGLFERDGIDHHLAEDMAQEVLDTVFRKLADLRDPRRFGAWIRMIAKNRMRSRLRRAHLTEELRDDDRIEVRDGISRLYGDDLRRLVREEVGRFGGNARRLLELKILEDRSPSEIVSILGITPDCFRKRFHVAIKLLRERVRSRIADAWRLFPEQDESDER